MCGVCLTLFPTLLEFLDSSSLQSFRCVFLCLLLIVCHTLSGCTCVESFLHLWPLVLRLFSLCLLSRWGTSPHACHMLTCSCLSLFVCLFFWLKSCFPWLCLVLCCSVHECLFFCSAVIFLLCICFLHLVLNGWVLKQWLGKNVGHETRSQSSPEF